MNIQDLVEVKENVSRAFKGALYSMDYQLLKIIIETSEKATAAIQA